MWTLVRAQRRSKLWVGSGCTQEECCWLQRDTQTQPSPEWGKTGLWQSNRRSLEVESGGLGSDLLLVSCLGPKAWSLEDGVWRLPLDSHRTKGVTAILWREKGAEDSPGTKGKKNVAQGEKNWLRVASIWTLSTCHFHFGFYLYGLSLPWKEQSFGLA